MHICTCAGRSADRQMSSFYNMVMNIECDIFFCRHPTACSTPFSPITKSWQPPLARVLRLALTIPWPFRGLVLAWSWNTRSSSPLKHRQSSLHWWLVSGVASTAPWRCALSAEWWVEFLYVYIVKRHPRRQVCGHLLCSCAQLWRPRKRTWDRKAARHSVWQTGPDIRASQRLRRLQYIRIHLNFWVCWFLFLTLGVHRRPHTARFLWGNLSEGRCSLVRKTAELVVK